ncbi:MAG: DUF1285 domain-containing protein [Saccharospirillum sp.]
MNLEQLLAHIQGQSRPPVEQWHPDYCGELDMRIARNGTWYHEGSPIGRQAMVRLFASILKREEGRYYLVTPVEKVGIHVEATPFVVVQAQCLEGTWILTNNLGESVPLDAEHPLDVITAPETPMVVWRSNLPARVHQNVMYQWQTEALDDPGLDPEGRLWLRSGKERYLLAQTAEPASG